MNTEWDINLFVARDATIRFAPEPAEAVVDNLNFLIKKGELTALVGESGSGKSLLAHAMIGILSPEAQLSATKFAFSGVDLRDPRGSNWRDLRGREIAIVFQNPKLALSPVRKVGLQIADVIREHRGLHGQALRDAVTEALRAVSLPDPERRYHAYPQELSGGMCQRVMMAMALSGDPRLLIADEPTTGLDTTTQAAILELIAKEARERGMACLLITHDLALARQFAQRVVVMHAGQIVEDAPSEKIFSTPRHPYSEALLRATPADADDIQNLGSIPGNFPDLRGAVPACRFADRCPRALAVCRDFKPGVGEIDGTRVACWNPIP